MSNDECQMTSDFFRARMTKKLWTGRQPVSSFGFGNRGSLASGCIRQMNGSCRSDGRLFADNNIGRHFTAAATRSQRDEFPPTGEKNRLNEDNDEDESGIHS